MDIAPGTKVFIVPYCHPDWAWTHTRHWHAERYTLAFQEALSVLQLQEVGGVPDDASHAFRWYIDVFITQLQPFLERYPELLSKLQQWIARGRIAICGGYANVRINHVEGETFARSLVYGRRAFEVLFPEADLSVHADLVDVAWGHPQLPQILRLAGYRYLRGWRPHDALNAKGVPSHFLWEGLDGTAILCSRGSYGGVVHPELIPPDFRDRWTEVVQLWRETELKDQLELSPVPIFWVQHGTDDNRPLRAIFGIDTPLDIPGFIQEWNQREASHMHFATPIEVFGELEKQRSQLPTVYGTIDPCDVCYNAAWNGAHGLWWWRREAARTLLRAELLTVLAQQFGMSYPRETLEALWRETLLFSCHATQWLFQDDFGELVARAKATVWQACKQAESAAATLAAQADLPVDSLAVVVNPLPFERMVDVPLLATFVEGDKGGVPVGLRLLDAQGREIPYQVHNELWHEGVRWELDVLARLNLPAGGWNVVRWATGESSMPTTQAAASLARAPRIVLENEFLQLTFHQGRLARVVDKETGHADDAPDHTPFGHLRASLVDSTAPLHAGPILGGQDVEWLDWAIVEQGPVRQTVRARGRVGSHAVMLEIRLPAGERRVELAATVDWLGMEGFLALHLPLPFAGELWGGLPYGVEQKELGREPYVGFERQREGMFWAQHFVDWTDGTRGLAYLPHNGDTYYILDRKQHVLAHILVNSFRRMRDTWEKDINAEIEGEGRHRFTASLFWHTGDWRVAQLWRTAEALTTPALVVRRRHGRGHLPAVHMLLRVEPANVSLAALYREGETILARLYETTGQATTATLTMPIPVREVTPVTLLNEPLPVEDDQSLPTISADGYQVDGRLRPWQIQTWALRM